MGKQVFLISIVEHDDAYEVTGHWGGGTTEEMSRISTALAEWALCALKLTDPINGSLIVSIMSTAIEVVKIEDSDFAADMRNLAFSMRRE